MEMREFFKWEGEPQKRSNNLKKSEPDTENQRNHNQLLLRQQLNRIFNNYFEDLRTISGPFSLFSEVCCEISNRTITENWFCCFVVAVTTINVNYIVSHR